MMAEPLEAVSSCMEKIRLENEAKRRVDVPAALKDVLVIMDGVEYHDRVSIVRFIQGYYGMPYA